MFPVVLFFFSIPFKINLFKFSTNHLKPLLHLQRPFASRQFSLLGSHVRATRQPRFRIVLLSSGPLSIQGLFFFGASAFPVSGAILLLHPFLTLSIHHKLVVWAN